MLWRASSNVTIGLSSAELGPAVGALGGTFIGILIAMAAGAGGDRRARRADPDRPPARQATHVEAGNQATSTRRPKARPRRNSTCAPNSARWRTGQHAQGGRGGACRADQPHPFRGGAALRPGPRSGARRRRARARRDRGGDPRPGGGDTACRCWNIRCWRARSITPAAKGQEVRDDLYMAIATVLAFVLGLNAERWAAPRRRSTCHRLRTVRRERHQNLLNNPPPPAVLSCRCRSIDAMTTTTSTTTASTSERPPPRIIPRRSSRRWVPGSGIDITSLVSIARHRAICRRRTASSRTSRPTLTAQISGIASGEERRHRVRHRVSTRSSTGGTISTQPTSSNSSVLTATGLSGVETRRAGLDIGRQPDRIGTGRDHQHRDRIQPPRSARAAFSLQFGTECDRQQRHDDVHRGQFSSPVSIAIGRGDATLSDDRDRRSTRRTSGVTATVIARRRWPAAVDQGRDRRFAGVRADRHRYRFERGRAPACRR